MNITRIVASRVELPPHESTYKWSGGKSAAIFDSTVVVWKREKPWLPSFL